MATAARTSSRPRDGLKHPPTRATASGSSTRNSIWATTGFIYTMDVNGDGLPDLVTTLGHDYGIFWYEQKKDAQGNRTWVKHVIDNAWSQAHALTIADLKGDGKPVLVTGKRYYAHEHDKGANEPLGSLLV